MGGFCEPIVNIFEYQFSNLWQIFRTLGSNVLNNTKKKDFRIQVQ